MRPTASFNRTAHPRLTIVCQVKSKFLHISRGIDPLYVGELVREGIESSWPYIFTDCEFEPMIEARLPIKRGFDRIRQRNARR